MLHKKIPFLRNGLPLCLGIISGLYIKPGIYFNIVISLVIISGLILSLFFNRQLSNYIYGPVISVALFSCGFILYTKEKSNISLLQSEQSVFVTTLSDYPQEKENTYLLTLRLNQRILKDNQFPVKGSIVLYHKKDLTIKTLLPGDYLIIRCTPQEIVNRGNPFEFDFKFYMETKGIRYYAFTDSTDILSHHSPGHRKLAHRALIKREKIIKIYESQGITGERLALVAAITLGQKNLLDPEQKQSFIKAGVMHIMAVSGLHAVILSLFIFNLLFFFKGRYNVLRIIITILILWAFAFVTGLSPSVLRATLMYSFLQAGNLMNRRVNNINSVLASAFVLMLIRPSVIFDAGFLLSYAAVIFIIGFYQNLYLMLQFKSWLADKIWQSSVVTLVAQAGTLPITIMLFNRFPVYFLLTNLIIVPISSLMIVVGCLVPLTLPIHFVSHSLASFLSFLTWLTEFLTVRASALPYSTIENIGMTPVECILLTGVISLFMYFLLKKESVSIIYILIALIFFLGGGTIKEIINRRSNEMIVYNTSGYSAIGIRTGHILNLYSDNISIPPEVARHCASLGLKLEFRQQSKSFQLLKTGGKTIMITDSLKSGHSNYKSINYLILRGNKPYIDRNYTISRLPENIIVSSEAGSGFHLPYQLNYPDKYAIWFVRKSGAYRHQL